MCACLHKHSTNIPQIVQFIKMKTAFKTQDSSAQFLFLQINLMTDIHIARSSDPSQLNIDRQAIDIIKNSLIKFKVNSEYYVKIHGQENFSFMMFLCLYQDKISTNKINAAFKSIDQYQYQEIKSIFLDIKHDPFNIADVFEEKSSKFNHNEKLFKDNAKFFANLPLNSIFQNAVYSKTLRICQYKEKSLTQFKAIPFKAKSIEDNKIQEVIVIFPMEKGYNVGCFSAKNRKVANPSLIMEEEEIKPIKAKKQSEKKEEKEIEKAGNESEATEVQEKMKANPKQEVQAQHVQLDEETQLYEQKDYNTFFALLAILAIIFLVHKFM